MKRITVRHGFAWMMAFIMMLSIVVVSPELSMQAEAAAKKVTVKKVTSVNLLTNSKTIYLAKGKKATLKTTVTVTPDKPANRKVTYKSSDKKVAAVTNKGVITGKKAGTAKITVASKKNGKKKAAVTVKVVNGKVTSIRLNRSYDTLVVGDSVKLTATVKISKGGKKNVVWTSSNTKVASVDKKGTVKAVGEGTAAITVLAADGTDEKAVCRITVKAHTEEEPEAEKYSYEVIPLMAPFNSYFYIKTDNPDPDSFRFVDEKTKYADEGKTGSVTPTDTVFSDVKYENSKTMRVNGGYIAAGSATDGGELRLQLGRVTGTHPVYNISTGETIIEKDYEYKDTTVTVQVDGLKNVVDYLISTYGDSSKPYFDNLSGIQSGFSSECLYSGVYVLGEQKKSTTAPYYGLSTSPHVDQTFYIQSPYYREDSKSMLISALYPMKYDSIGFPSVMGAVAKELDSTATVKWSSAAHYLVEVTYNGETRVYGGAGEGRGQGINADQIRYWYSFDGSNEDACMKCNLKDVYAMILEYGAMEVPEEPTDQPKLTWGSVRQTVGKEGSYVKLILITSIFGGSAEGYTFMYDDGSTGEGSQGWGAVGHFTNAWYDGRYFNRWEYYYPGAKFEDTVKTESPSIIMKDVCIKLPDDGKTYYYNYNTIDKAGRYNTETGVWNGFMTYSYDAESQTWKADILNCIMYRDDDYNYKHIEDQDFMDACTITMDEALAMNLDANTDKEPENYYIYDRVTSPGTYHSAGN